jgi:hypothetical protein
MFQEQLDNLKVFPRFRGAHGHHRAANPTHGSGHSSGLRSRSHVPAYAGVVFGTHRRITIVTWKVQHGYKALLGSELCCQKYRRARSIKYSRTPVKAVRNYCII